jgi:hypothetical protein
VDETLQETWTVALTLKEVVVVAARVSFRARHNAKKPITKTEDTDLIVPSTSPSPEKLLLKFLSAHLR